MTNLLLRVEPHLGAPFERRAEGAPLVLGRSSSADIVVPDRFMSRLQARFFREREAWYIEDLGSSNPTRLNGRRVTRPARVVPGDVISVSDTRVHVEGLEEGLGPGHAEETLFRPAASLIAEREGRTDPDLPGDAGLKYRSDRLRLLNELHRALAAPITLEELLELILDRAMADLRPEEAVIFLRRPDGELYHAASRRAPGLTTEFLFSRSLTREVTEKGMAALVLDVSADERFQSAQSMMDSGVRSLVAAPLLDPQGNAGMIALNSRTHVRCFSEEDMEELVSLASVAALRIRNIALAEEAAQRRLLEKELAVARQIQMALLPEELPELPGYELFASNIPTRAVSGDFYEARLRRDGRECVLLMADVSGKGMSASLLTASLEALAIGPIEVGDSPEEICSKLSLRLYARTSPERYATGFVASLDLASGRLQYCNAGHNPALLVRCSEEPLKLDATGLPLGLLNVGDYALEELTLEPGELLFIYTDGVTEAANPSGEEYGLERLIELCRGQRHASVAEQAAALDRELEAFTQGTPYADDRTFMMLRRLE